MRALKAIGGFYGFGAPVPAHRTHDQDGSTWSECQPPVLVEGASFGEALLYSTDKIALPRLSGHGGGLGPLVVRAASLAGNGHLDRGASREDDFGVRIVEGLGLAVAVADGVGDSDVKYSAVGASCAVEAVLNETSLLSRERGKLTLPTDYAVLGDRIVELASERLHLDVDPRDLQATLLVAVFDMTGNYEVNTVGDTEFLVGGSSGWRIGSGNSVSGVANEPGPTVPYRATRVERFSGALSPGEFALAATDGVGPAVRDPRASSLFLDGWRYPPTMEHFLTDMAFTKKGENDDRTAVCVWLRSEGDS